MTGEGSMNCGNVRLLLIEYVLPSIRDPCATGTPSLATCKAAKPASASTGWYGRSFCCFWEPATRRPLRRTCSAARRVATG